MTIKDLHAQVSQFEDTTPMPVLFVGHGSPMNALEDNDFTRSWTSIGSTLPTPRAIVCISAHWETRGTFVTAMQQPRTIHDFYGFPEELYAQQYAAKGSPEMAHEIMQNVYKHAIEDDFEWGLDHGSWTVLKYFFPLADVPVLQISIDHFKDAKCHVEFAKELAFLRKKGVLVVGSGNIIHNLRMMRLISNDINTEYGFDWALELNEIFNNKIVNNNIDDLANYSALHKDVRYAIPTPEHYIPMLYALAMRNENDKLTLFNDRVIAGSLNMTSFMIGA